MWQCADVCVWGAMVGVYHWMSPGRKRTQWRLPKYDTSLNWTYISSASEHFTTWYVVSRTSECWSYCKLQKPPVQPNQSIIENRCIETLLQTYFALSIAGSMSMGYFFAFHLINIVNNNQLLGGVILAVIQNGVYLRYVPCLLLQLHSYLLFRSKLLECDSDLIGRNYMGGSSGLATVLTVCLQCALRRVLQASHYYGWLCWD